MAHQHDLHHHNNISQKLWQSGQIVNGSAGLQVLQQPQLLLKLDGGVKRPGRSTADLNTLDLQAGVAPEHRCH